MKRPTLREFLQQQPTETPQEEPKSLSPVHFRTIAQSQDELNAYSAAYQQFLKFYERDPEKQDAFGQLLYDALYKRDTDLLLGWYHGHRMFNNYKMNRAKKSP